MNSGPRDLWLSSPKMTFSVTVDADDRVTAAAPIARKFIGQPLVNLTDWLKRQGGVVQVRELKL